MVRGGWWGVARVMGEGRVMGEVMVRCEGSFSTAGLQSVALLHTTQSSAVMLSLVAAVEWWRELESASSSTEPLSITRISCEDGARAISCSLTPPWMAPRSPYLLRKLRGTFNHKWTPICWMWMVCMCYGRFWFCAAEVYSP